MTIKPLQLSVLVPTDTIRTAQDVKSVQVSLTSGYSIGIYPGHAPLLAETVAGPLRYIDGSGEHTLNLEAGILQIDGNVVRVLTGEQTPTAEEKGEAQDFAELHPPAETPRFDRLAQEMLTALHTRMQGTQADDEG